MRRALAAAAITAVTLTGCGSSGGNATDDSTPEQTAAATGSDQPTPVPTATEPADDEGAIEVEVEGDTVSPNGERIHVDKGETVLLEVESDRAGAFHVHSTPEQELEFGPGETLLELTIDTPGIVDVEEHEAGVVVLQLEVS